MNTTELSATAVEHDQIEGLRTFTRELRESPLRTALESIVDSVEAGEDLAILEKSSEYTPNQAAKLLNVSRSFLIKLMDAGELPFHHVGRDRRILGRDLILFQKQRETDTRRFVEQRANHHKLRDAALDEMTDLI